MAREWIPCFTIGFFCAIFVCRLQQLRENSDSLAVDPAATQVKCRHAILCQKVNHNGQYNDVYGTDMGQNYHYVFLKYSQAPIQPCIALQYGNLDGSFRMMLMFCAHT